MGPCSAKRPQRPHPPRARCQCLKAEKRRCPQSQKLPCIVRPMHHCDYCHRLVRPHHQENNRVSIVDNPKPAGRSAAARNAATKARAKNSMASEESQQLMFLPLFSTNHSLGSSLAHDLLLEHYGDGGPMSKKGIPIAVEGMDGSGKSTQVKLLYHWLRAKGCRSSTPSGTPARSSSKRPR